MLTWVEIEAGNVRSNIDAFRTIATQARIMAVVKANAYGHGLQQVAPLAAERADWLGVNTLEEALTIRQLGIDKPIAILGHTEREHAETIVRKEFRQVVYRTDLAAALSSAAEKCQMKALIHIKIETGTNRQGVDAASLPAFITALQNMPGIQVDGVYTHFANIEDTLDPSFAELQLRRFRDAISILNEAGIRPPHVHAAATAGALLYPETEFSMIRVGIGAYGIWPSRETQIAARERGRKISLRPVLAWKTRVAQVKTIAAGSYVGYGLTFQATRQIQIAVLPVGYYDGYDRKLSNGGRVLIKSRPAPIVGRIAMNMMMVDVTDVGAAPDDEVVLLGRQGDSEIRVEELADRVGSIPYEVLCRINPTIPRITV
jgi:alanine racemase